jgi:predicted nuclease with TOPRIM domain
MLEKLMTMLVGILLALAGWSLSRTFELSTIQAVHEDKVQKLERQVIKLEDKMDKMMDSDEEIMDQHKKLFEKLESGNTGYSYN